MNPQQIYARWQYAPAYCASQYFVDVSCSHWAFNYIKWASDNSIIKGFSGPECATVPIAYPCYQPTINLNRAQTTAALYRGENWTPYTPPSPTFSDVPSNDWAYTYIETAVHNGVISGFDAATCQARGVAYPCFLPTDPLNRAQICAFIYRAHHLTPFTPTNPTFSDVPANHWAYLYIETSNHAHIVDGYPDGTFAPNRNLTRDQSAKVMYRTYYTGGGQ